MGSGPAWLFPCASGRLSPSSAAWLIPWIEKLRSDHPALELELTVETTPILVEQVQRGTLDLVFAALPASAERRSQPRTAAHGNGLHGSPATAPQAALHAGRVGSAQEILTFQRGSLPHVAVVDLFRQAAVEPKRVHTISSISAMVQLVQGGFGVATLPRSAVQRLLTFPNLKQLSCEAALQPLPIHASYRTDPTTQAVETVVRSAFTYMDVSNAGRRSSKKSMK